MRCVRVSRALRELVVKIKTSLRERNGASVVSCLRGGDEPDSSDPSSPL
jgi:hypothetical protein